MHDLSFNISKTPLGDTLFVASNDGLVSLYFTDTICVDDTLLSLQKFYAGKIINKPNQIIKETQQQLKSYFKKQTTTFSVPLLLNGTAFQESVWHALQQIPCGSTKSYMQVAESIDNPKAVRATGSAVGANKINILIPCHRVILTDGKIGNYGGNTITLNRKRYLLELESPC